jgi:peroxiredoxin
MFCRGHMAQLRQDYHKFVERGAEVLVVGPDDEAAFKKYWRKEDLPFVGLADPSHQVADRYGQEVSLLRLGRMPAMMVIDRRGMVRYKHYGFLASDIPSTEEILAVLDELNRGEAAMPDEVPAS